MPRCSLVESPPRRCLTERVTSQGASSPRHHAVRGKDGCILARPGGVTIWQPYQRMVTAMRAHVHPLTPTTDASADVARLAALAFKPQRGETSITAERWREISRAVQVALALLNASKEKLTAAMAEDSAALDAAIDELAGHSEFLSDVANLLRRAQARLQMSQAAERLRTGSRLVAG